MKKTILSLLVLAFAGSTRAQLFTPESWNGTVLGGIIGGIIGNNSHGRTGEGIAIGAGAGWLLGTMTHESRVARGWYSPDYVYAGPQVSARVGAYPVVNGSYGYAPVNAYGRPSRAWNGAVLGGITGAIIGNNSHGRTAEGAAIGAASGLVLGSIADAATSQRPVSTAGAPPRRVYIPPSPRPVRMIPVRRPIAPTPVVILRVEDAPRVPDAPRF